MKSSRRFLFEPVVWTNLLFLLNSVLWYFVGFFAVACLIAATAIASFMHHFYREMHDTWHKIDVALAYTSLTVTLGVSIFNLSVLGWIFALTCILSGLALKDIADGIPSEYQGFHSAWHLCVFAGQTVLAITHDSGVL